MRGAPGNRRSYRETGLTPELLVESGKPVYIGAPKELDPYMQEHPGPQGFHALQLALFGFAKKVYLSDRYVAVVVPGAYTFVDRVPGDNNVAAPNLGVDQVALIDQEILGKANGIVVKAYSPYVGFCR